MTLQRVHGGPEAAPTSRSTARCWPTSRCSTSRRSRKIAEPGQSQPRRTEPLRDADARTSSAIVCARRSPTFARGGRSPRPLENAKARYLGKAGELTELLKALGKLPPEERSALRARRSTRRRADRGGARGAARASSPTRSSTRGSPRRRST